MSAVPGRVRIVLVRSRNPLNIGAAARAMANFGLSDLVVVDPYGPAWREARSAVGAEELLRRSRQLTLAEAVADCQLVLGTTAARRRELQQPMVPLPALGGFLRERLPAGGGVALLFGSEKIGLRNEDFQHCHALLSVPTSAGAPSMNLAQAVAVVAYELSRPPAAPPPGGGGAIREPGYAAPVGHQIERLVELSQRALERIGYMQHMPAATRAEKLRRAFLRWRMTRGDATMTTAFLRRLLASPRGMALCLALSAFQLAGSPARAAGDQGGWHETLTPQLQVLHAATFLPRSFMMEVGKIHGRLKMDIAMFAPWMSRDRVKIYVYQDRRGYLQGEFNPPSWSNGISFADRRLIATYLQEGGSRKTTEIISHEMAHVLFESYWTEKGQSPPVWLNEGLAMLEEADPARPEDSDWYKAMGTLTDGQAFPMARFVEFKPMEEGSKVGKEEVTRWYVQAYSVVYFLYRQHTRLQFFHLVKGLRDGKPLTDLLWQVYRHRTLEDFEAAWRAWLKMPAVQDRLGTARLGRPGASASSESPPDTAGSSGRPSKKLKTSGFEGMGFRSWAPDGRR